MFLTNYKYKYEKKKMALGDKIKIVANPAAIQSSPTTGTATASSAANSSSKAIPINENTKKTDPITETIRTPEFQALSNEEQIKKLKELFPNVDEKELLTTLNTVKSTIEQEKKAENSKAHENPSSEESKASNEEKSSVENTSTQPKNEQETLIEEYAKKLGKNASIDDVLAHIKSKSPESLTDIEKSIIEFINKPANKEQHVFSKNELKDIISQYADQLDNLIPQEVIKSQEWQKKSPMEKLDARADEILKQMIPDFETNSESAKKSYREAFYNNVGQSTNPDWGKLNEKQQKARIEIMSALVDAAEHSGKSIKELISATPKEKAEITMDYIDDKIISKIPITNGQNGSKQVDKIAEAILNNIDHNYKNLSNAEKNEKKENLIDEIGKNLYKDWDKLNESQKDIRKEFFATELNALKSSNLSLKDYQAMSPKERIEVIQNYQEKYKINVSPENQVRQDTIKRCNKTDITDADIKETLENKLKDGSITGPERRLLKKLNKKEKAFGHDVMHRHTHKPEETIDYIVINNYNGDINEFIKAKIPDIEKAKNDPEAIKTIIHYCDSPDLAKYICKVIGVDYHQYASEDQAMDMAAEGLADGNVEQINEANKIFHNKEATRGRIDQVSAVVPEEIKEQKDRTKYAVETLKLDTQYSTAIAKSWNNTEVVSTQEAKELAGSLCISEEVSNAAKAVFTKDFITTAQNDNIRVDYAKTLSTIQNAAVTEGLAAATNSIKDPGIKNQYNSYVDNAIKNYPPEQQAVIKSARQTGEVSQATLSQNTVSATSGSEKTANTNNSQTIENSSSNVQTQGRTNTSSSPTVKNTPSASQNTKTIPSQAVRTAVISKELQQKAQALMDKISSYETAKAERTEKREQEKTKQAEKNGNTPAIKTDVKTSSPTKTETVSETQKTEELVLTGDEENTLIQIFQSGGTNALYNELGKFGENSQRKFLEILVQKGRASDVVSFAENHKDNPDVILNLLSSCQSGGLKLDLLRMLPSNTINEMVRTQRITSTDFNRLVRDGKIESKTIMEYISKNKGSMSLDEMKKYSSFLSLADQNELNRLINQKLGNAKGSDEWLMAQRENMRTTTSDEPSIHDENLATNTLAKNNDIPTLDDGLSVGSNKLSMRGQYDKMKKKGPFYIKA